MTTKSADGVVCKHDRRVRADGRFRALVPAHALRAALLASCSLAALAPAAVGAEVPISWLGETSSSWNDPSNWSGNTKAFFDDDVIIDTKVPFSSVLLGSSASVMNVSVGASNSAELQVGGGASLAVGGSTVIGDGASSTGLVTVTGTGTTLDTSYLAVGNYGWGELAIVDGARVVSTFASVGASPDSVGVVTVTGGSALFASDEFTVGSEGSGTLTVLGGSEVTSSNGALGWGTGGVGTVTVSGAGSRWDNSAGFLTVGYHGTASLTVADGGELVSATGYVAYEVGSSAVVTVTGAGSSWTNSETLIAGNYGSATVRVNAGAQLSSVGGLLGQGAGSVGSVEIDGAGSSWEDTDGMVVGNLGKGTLSVLNGGRVAISKDLTVGHDTGTGTLVVDPTGRVTVGGNVVMGANANYVVSVAPSSTPTGSLITAGGLTTISPDAVVTVLARGGGHALSTKYTILTANSVSGTFGGVSSNLAYLVPELTYDPQNVFLTLVRNGLAFDAVAGTANQKASAAALEALGTGAVFDAAVQLSTADAPAAFDALSGEGHATYKGVMVENSAIVRNAAIGRMDQTFAAPDGAGAASAYAGGSVSVAGDGDGVGLWGTLYGAVGSVASNGNAAGSAYSSGGLVLGADGLLGNWRLGFLANAGVTGLSSPDRDTSGSSTDYGVGLYGGTEWGDTGLAFGAAYTRHAVSTTRDVALPGLTETLTVDYGAATSQVFGELTHQFDLGDLEFTPFAQVAYVNHATDGFTEQGGSAALTSVADVVDGTFTTLGLRAKRQFLVDGDKLLELTGAAGWRHAFAGLPTASNSYAGGSAFTVAAAPIAADALSLEAGVGLDLAGNASLGLAYNGQIGAGTQSHALKATLGGQF